jgi:ribose transport system ATP-binding protein
MTGLLSVKGLSKAWYGVPANVDLNFTLREGTVTGIIGQNGAGKSTLMGMLGGTVLPSSGEMFWRGAPYQPHDAADATRAGIGFIHQELNLFTNLSVAENLYIDGFPRRFGLVDWPAIRRRTKEILARLSLDFDPMTQVGQLSPGERQLVEIARALHNEASLLIFDEPTTSLTPRETERLFATIEGLKAEGRTIIYISHILSDVQRLSDEILVLRDGQLVEQGPAADFSIARMIRSMIGRDMAGLYPERRNLPTPEVILEASNLTQPGVLQDVSLSIHRGEIVGLFGLMGSGRTELARILFGLDPHETGEILLEGKPPGKGPRSRIEAGIAFVTEERRAEGLMMEASIAYNLGLVQLTSFGRGPLGLLDRWSMAQRSEAVRNELSIKATDIQVQPAKSLSGGNQQKVVIGKWQMGNPRLFILDEPTRGVDVGAKFEIYSLINQIAANGGGVLMISSELEELLGTADRIVVMNRGEVTGEVARDEFDRERILAMAFREVVA